MTKVINASGTTFLLGLFAIGLMLRLLGLMFNGIQDLDQMIFQWGCRVKELGLATAFRESYGVLSYALFGIAATIADNFPGSWWAPYKVMEVSFEVATLLTLYRLLPEGRRHLALTMYWINPWFVLHGAWQGFWDGAHTLLALLAVLCLAQISKKRLSWALAGIVLMASAMFKPQGLVYFVIPLLIYLGLQMSEDGSPFIWLTSGLIFVVTLTSALLVLGGGEVFAIAQNYFTIATVMPNLCNDAINIWRPITKALQAVLNQSGPTFWLWLPPSIYSLLHLLVLSATMALTAAFSLRILLSQGWQLSYPKARLIWFVRFSGLIALIVALGLSKQQVAIPHFPLDFGLISGVAMVSGCIAVLAAPVIARLIQRVTDLLVRSWRRSFAGEAVQNFAPPVSVLLVLAFSSLVIPQLGTMAHMNHTYAGLVLVIPLAISNRRILLCWVFMVAINFYCHLAVYHLGRSTVLPEQFLDYGPAKSLVSQVEAAIGTQTYDPLLQFHISANEILARYLPQEPLISVLSVIQFMCVVVLLREMFALAGRPTSHGAQLALQ